MEYVYLSIVDIILYCKQKDADDRETLRSFVCCNIRSCTKYQCFVFQYLHVIYVYHVNWDKYKLLHKHLSVQRQNRNFESFICSPSSQTAERKLRSSMTFTFPIVNAVTSALHLKYLRQHHNPLHSIIRTRLTRYNLFYQLSAKYPNYDDIT